MSVGETSIGIRPIEATDHDAVQQLLTERWQGSEIMLDGEMIDAAQLPGFLAEKDGELVGLVTLIKREAEWEILTLDSLKRWAGTGTLLLEDVVEAARAVGIRRLIVRTSNDNLDAFRFYQRRSFRLESVTPGVIDKERVEKPGIPLIGQYGIPLHDEVIFGAAI